MARKQRAEQWADHRRQRDEAERQCRVMVIAQFDGGDSRSKVRASLALLQLYQEDSARPVLEQV